MGSSSSYSTTVRVYNEFGKKIDRVDVKHNHDDNITSYTWYNVDNNEQTNDSMVVKFKTGMTSAWDTWFVKFFQDGNEYYINPYFNRGWKQCMIEAGDTNGPVTIKIKSYSNNGIIIAPYSSSSASTDYSMNPRYKDGKAQSFFAGLCSIGQSVAKASIKVVNTTLKLISPGYKLISSTYKFGVAGYKFFSGDKEWLDSLIEGVEELTPFPNIDISKGIKSMRSFASKIAEVSQKHVIPVLEDSTQTIIEYGLPITFTVVKKSFDYGIPVVRDYALPYARDRAWPFVRDYTLPTVRDYTFSIIDPIISSIIQPTIPPSTIPSSTIPSSTIPPSTIPPSTIPPLLTLQHTGVYSNCSRCLSALGYTQCDRCASCIASNPSPYYKWSCCGQLSKNASGCS